MRTGRPSTRWTDDVLQAIDRFGGGEVGGGAYCGTVGDSGGPVPGPPAMPDAPVGRALGEGLEPPGVAGALKSGRLSSSSPSGMEVERGP